MFSFFFISNSNFTKKEGYMNIYEHILYTGCLLKKVGAMIGSMEEVKENKKVLYHSTNFAIVNELLIIKNRCISPAYWLMQACDEMWPPCQRGC